MLEVLVTKANAEKFRRKNNSVLFLQEAYCTKETENIWRVTLVNAQESAIYLTTISVLNNETIFKFVGPSYIM